MKYSIRLSGDLTNLLNDKEQLPGGVRVLRNTYMGNQKRCEIDSVDKTKLFVYFKDEGECQQTWKKTSKLWRKHGISLTHLMHNYSARIFGNKLDFIRKPGRWFFRDD